MEPVGIDASVDILQESEVKSVIAKASYLKFKQSTNALMQDFTFHVSSPIVRPQDTDDDFAPYIPGEHMTIYFTNAPQEEIYLPDRIRRPNPPNEKRKTVGVFAGKVLDLWSVLFAEANHSKGQRSGKGEVRTKQVSIDIDIMMDIFGYDPMKRQDRQTFRTKLKGAISVFSYMQIEWDDGSDAFNFGCSPLLVCWADNNTLYFETTTPIANEMVNSPTSQINPVLFKLDERKTSAFAMAKKMQYQYYRDSNYTNGTYRTLKVSTLLKDCPGIPSIEHVKEHRWGWHQKILEPFEENLESLISQGYLATWRYSRPKEELMLPEEEAQRKKSYDTWSDTNIYFELTNAQINVERIARNQAAQAKRKSRKKNTKKT